MHLVDTSVWIEVFRADTRINIHDLVAFDDIATCLPVVQEVLQGFREDRAFQIAREAMFALPIVESPLSAEVFEHAVDLYRRARKAGLTVRSGIDCVIAACAERNQLTLLHHDRDFDALAQISHLSTRRAAIRK